MSVDKYVNCINTFAFDLFRLLCSNSQKNEFFSPFSVLTALNMTLLGAKNNTEKELFDGLRYSLGFKNSDEVHAFIQKTVDSLNNAEKECTLSVANRVLVHKTDAFSVNAEYSKQLQTIYKAQVDEVNFITDSDACVKSCNEWVKKATKGKIPSILDKLEQSTRAVILNAIYFKGVWEKTFDEKNTENLPFYNFGDKSKLKDVPQMFMRNAKGTLYSTTIDGEELRMFEIPYKGDISMNILLTKSLDGLKKIEDKLNYDTIAKMEIVAKKVDRLWLPKFKMETKYQLVNTLKLLGIKDAFTGNADFSGIRSEKDVMFSEVIHKAAIEVNEEGTVAAAATAIMMKMCLMLEDPIEFCVDHPFAYYIKDMENGVILFAGNVYEL